jgi:hypothetical protein
MQHRSTYVPSRVVRETPTINPWFPTLLDRAALENDDQGRCKVAEDDDEDEVFDKGCNPTHVPDAIRTLKQSPVSKTCADLVVADC